ncbi:hypothetical protein GCM10007927_09630 [Sulfitobacter pacificus]|uniref:Uncharacterized protein n=1 Tax=Sulfitobacter pacificus TaxID=1499314 RepID=A0ABQ5VGE8_9RHOB|nr:hypothetical protein GCM10007927_09630 [Sulfitobacter pacificus]
MGLCFDGVLAAIEDRKQNNIPVEYIEIENHIWASFLKSMTGKSAQLHVDRPSVDDEPRVFGLRVKLVKSGSLGEIPWRLGPLQ